MNHLTPGFCSSKKRAVVEWLTAAVMAQIDPARCEDSRERSDARRPSFEWHPLLTVFLRPRQDTGGTG
jgi:hypothetical protein